MNIVFLTKSVYYYFAIIFIGMEIMFSAAGALFLDKIITRVAMVFQCAGFIVIELWLLGLI